MGSRTAKQSRWATGQRWHDEPHNGRQTIAANAEAAQFEAMQDGWQRRSQLMAATLLQWTAEAVMGNNGSAMGRWTAEQLQWAMRRRQRETIAANAEAAQWEFGFLDLCFVLLRSHQCTVELLFLVQWFIVLVQQNLTDWGLCVPTLTPVDE